MTFADPPCAPISLQEKPYSCTAAALRSVLAYLDDVHPESELRQRIGVTEHGANALMVAAAARELGYQAQIVICAADVPSDRRFRPALAELGALANRGLMPLTSVASWTTPGRNHFIVVCAVTTQGVLCMDPKLGYRFCLHGEWYQHWHTQDGDRIAVIIQPGDAAVGDLAHYRDEDQEPLRPPSGSETAPEFTTRNATKAAYGALHLHNYLKSAKVDGDGVVVKGPGGRMFLRAVLYDPEAPDIKLVPDHVNGLKVEIVIKARSDKA